MEGVKKEVPTGVKIISVLYYIATFIIFLLFITTLLESILSFFGKSLSPTIQNYLVFSGVVLLVTSFIILAIGIFSFFIAKGLWNLKPWTRKAAAGLSALSAVNSFMSIFEGNFLSIAFVILHVWIVYYLWYNKEVKSAFGIVK